MDVKIINSPTGNLRLRGDKKAVREISWTREKRKADRLPLSHALNKAAKELNEYFCGKRKIFSFPIAFKGTIFQKKVWTALQKIPYGKTVSYQDIAIRVGSPRSARAVGLANNKNPLPLIIPCHRVIGKNGHLLGFGSGLNKKKWLLELERLSIN